jgi:inosine-uridine nucleoside N-ribohydrolase
MGGAYSTQYREANVAIDPEAASIVFRSGIPLMAIGFEEAGKVSLPLSIYPRSTFAATPLGAFYRSMARGYSWAYQKDSVTLYDVTAAVAAVRPDWFTSVERWVSVELHGRTTRGMTVVQQDHVFNSVPDSVPLTVVSDYDDGAVLRLFRQSVLEGNWPAGV